MAFCKMYKGRYIAIFLRDITVHQTFCVLILVKCNKDKLQLFDCVIDGN